VNTLLEVTDLSVGYTRPVVGPISFRVEPGEVVGLQGPNGAGKSTLLRALAGMATIFAGDISRRQSLRISYQSQELPQLGEMPISGHDVLRSAAARRDDAPPPVTQLLHKRIDRMSSGEKQQVLVWAVLSCGADLVILDEPTNNLDPDAVSWVAETIRAPTDTRSAIVVSHDAAFVEQVCGRVVRVGA